MVSVQGVPEHGDAVAIQAEGDGALDGASGAVAGLADAEQVAGFAEGDLDGPAPGVPDDQVCRAGFPVGGDQGQVVGGVGAVVAQQDHADGPGVTAGRRRRELRAGPPEGGAPRSARTALFSKPDTTLFSIPKAF